MNRAKEAGQHIPEQRRISQDTPRLTRRALAKTGIAFIGSLALPSISRSEASAQPVQGHPATTPQARDIFPIAVAIAATSSADTLQVEPTVRPTSPRFLDYWQTHGGLEQQGNALTDEFTEVNPSNGQPYSVQYFERARFEYHPEADDSHKVMLGLLGREQYVAKYPDRPLIEDKELATVPAIFKAYWETHGGLAQQGYPICEPFEETNPTNGQIYTTQYFERARFEQHPENKDPEYQVLLGLLGREQLMAKYPDGAPHAADMHTAEGIMQNSRIITSESTTLDGKTYTFESRSTVTTPYQITLNKALQDEFGQLVAENGAARGFSKAELIILDPQTIQAGEQSMPEGAENVGWVKAFENNQQIPIGTCGNLRKDDTVYLYFTPVPGLVPEDPSQEVFANINWSLGDNFMRTIISGGDRNADVLAHQDRYLNLINQNILQLTNVK